jgi:hypothetical protein
MPELSRSKESQQSKVSSQAFDIPRISRKFSLRRPKTEYKVNQRREPLHSGATIVPINIGIPLISLAEAQRRQGESGSSFGPSAASSVVRSNSSGTVRVSPTSPKHNLARHGLESKAIVSSDQQPTSQLRPPLSSQAFELQACSGIRLGSCGQPLQLAAVASTLLATPKKYKEPADEMKDSLFTTKKHQESDRRTVSPIPFRIASADNAKQIATPNQQFSNDDHVYSIGTGIFDHSIRDPRFSEQTRFSMLDVPGNVLPPNSLIVEGRTSSHFAGLMPISTAGEAWWNVPSNTNANRQTQDQKTAGGTLDFSVSHLDKEGPVHPGSKTSTEKRHRKAFQEQAASKTTEDIVTRPLRVQRSSTTGNEEARRRFFDKKLWPDLWVAPSPTAVSEDGDELVEEYDEDYHDRLLEETIQELKALQPFIPQPDDVANQARRSGWIIDPRVGVGFHSSLKRWETTR